MHILKTTTRNYIYNMCLCEINYLEAVLRLQLASDFKNVDSKILRKDISHRLIRKLIFGVRFGGL